MRIKCIFVFALLASILLFAPAQASSKNLNGTMGVGFNTQFSSEQSTNMDGISVKVWPRDMPVGFQAVGGWQLGDDRNDEVTGGTKLIFPLKREENMNLYISGGMGISYINIDGGDDDLALSLIPAAGVEYFFQGLPNLGFSSELSGRIFFSDQYDEFKTTATQSGTSVTVGIHYYFPWF